MDVFIKHVLDDINNTTKLNYKSVVKVLKMYNNYSDFDDFIKQRILNVKFENDILFNKNKDMDLTNNRYMFLFKIFQNTIDYVKKKKLELNNFNLIFYTGEKQLFSKKKIKLFNIISTINNLLLIDR